LPDLKYARLMMRSQPEALKASGCDR